VTNAAILIAAIVYAMLVFWIVGRPRAGASANSLNFDQLEQKYSKYRKLDTALNLFVAIPLAFPLGWAFVQAMMRVSKDYWWQPGTLKLSAPSWGSWVGPAIFFTIAGVVAPMGVLWRLILRRNFDEWMEYGAMVMGMDPRRLIRILTVVCLVLATSLTLLFLNCYARATADGLAIRPFGSLAERQYRYAQIQKIQENSVLISEHGQRVPAYVITFTDGKTWSTQRWIKETNPDLLAEHQDFIEFVSRRAGVPVAPAH
jgi:hypothetical protein